MKVAIYRIELFLKSFLSHVKENRHKISCVRDKINKYFIVSLIIKQYLANTKNK